MRRILRRRRLPTASAVALVGTSGVVAAEAAVLPDYVGPHPDGTAVATYGWEITPAGKQVKLGEKPYGSALSPDGKYLAVGNDGINININIDSLQPVESATGDRRHQPGERRGDQDDRPCAVPQRAGRHEPTGPGHIARRPHPLRGQNR